MIKNSLSFNVLETHVCRVWQTVLPVTINGGVSAFFQKPGFQFITKGRQTAAFFIYTGRRQFARLAEPGYVRHVLRTSAPPSFLVPAKQERLELRSLPHVQHPYPFRGMELVSRK